MEELLQAQQRCGFELNLVHAPKPWNFHEVTPPSHLLSPSSLAPPSPTLTKINTRADLHEAGRSSGGTHFVFVDADEILTDNYRINNRLKELM